ncbi:MAG TPA: hypothetical protein VMU85_06295 [Stellaceae bacterium]|nr:hypothetical protein [Stellaceae bacterium]
MTTRIVAVTSADANYFPLLRDMILSMQSQPGLPQLELACFDLGLAPEHIHWLKTYTDRILTPRPHFDLSAAQTNPLQLAFLVRPFLPEYLPGFDLYLWIDSDVWLQSPDAILGMIEGASAKGMAIAHEAESAYRFQLWLFLWTAKHFVLGYGPARGTWLLTRPHLNAGIFAIAHDAPHWRAWADCYQAAIGRTGRLTPHDQFALNQAIYQHRLDAAILPANANWICDRGIPMWNDEANAFCEPYAPYRTVSALHLAGPAKRTSYAIQRTGGQTFETMIRYGAGPAH